MSIFCQLLYHRKCQLRGVGGQKKPKSCQRSLWTPPYLMLSRQSVSALLCSDFFEFPSSLACLLLKTSNDSVNIRLNFQIWLWNWLLEIEPKFNSKITDNTFYASCDILCTYTIRKLFLETLTQNLKKLFEIALQLSQYVQAMTNSNAT